VIRAECDACRTLSIRLELDKHPKNFDLTHLIMDIILEKVQSLASQLEINREEVATLSTKAHALRVSKREKKVEGLDV
jgi:hypothetical protein